MARENNRFVSWRILASICALLALTGSVVGFFTVWNRNQDAEVMETQSEVRFVRTSLDEHKGRVDSTFETLNETMRQQQRCIMETRETLVEVGTSQKAVVESIKELKQEVRDLRP